MQMGIIIVTPVVVGADAHPPAAVLVPAQGLHPARLHRHNGGPQGTHQVIAQMLAGKAVASAHPKIIAVAVAVPRRHRGKGLQPILRLPHLFPVFLHQYGVVPHQAPQGGGVGFQIIVVVFAQLPQQLLGTAAREKIPVGQLHGRPRHPSPGAAGSQCQKGNPAYGHILLLRADVQRQSLIQRLIAHMKIHPLDVVRRPGSRQHQRQNQQQNQNPFHLAQPP